MILPLLLMAGFPCAHGPVCDAHTVAFDLVEGADSYRVRWGTNAIGEAPEGEIPFYALETFEVCFASPCLIALRRPAPGNVVFWSVVAVNSFGEGLH